MATERGKRRKQEMRLGPVRGRRALELAGRT